MKITNSSIFMSSSHQEISYSYQESMTIEAAKSEDAAGAILTLSKEANGKSVKESMVEFTKMKEEENEKRRAENEARSLKQMAQQMKTKRADSPLDFKGEEDLEIKMLRRILALLRGEKNSKEESLNRDNNVHDIRSAGYKKYEGASFSLEGKTAISLGSISLANDNGNPLGTNLLQVGTNAAGTTWQRITATSGFHCEAESTTFATTGMVQTADGRNIDFNVEVSMSRAFQCEINMLEVKDYIKTDPLMINLDTNVGKVSDQKFFFDLDADGRKEEISFAGKGSGFLALDKDGDGKIGDGSELFGTSSGDGFADLSVYDEDKNGWIDENDSIFKHLVVWTKDENGQDKLLDLKKADVGAIYLGNADTQFSLKDEDNNLHGEIRKTGVYLKESTGTVGTLNHVDLVV